MVDESKKKDDFMGLDKIDLSLGLSALALAGLVGLGIKTLSDMQRTGQLPNLFPNPQLLAQQQQEMVNAQIAAQAQQDAQQEVAQPAAPEPEQSQLTSAEMDGVRTVPRRSMGGYDRINI
jgi:hypothetical protein